jgi:hypothetical protein
MGHVGAFLAPVGEDGGATWFRRSTVCVVGTSDDADALYELPPEEFVSARTELAKRLKAAGDAEGAVSVRSRKRPTVVAWAINQVARGRRADVRGLLEAGQALKAAQRRALTGAGAKTMQEAASRRKRAVERLTAGAAQVLREAGHSPTPAHLIQVSNTLLATATDADAAELVERGTLERPLPAPSGFGDDPGFEVIPGMRTDAEPGAGDEHIDTAGKGTSTAGKRAAKARERAARLAREADEAEAEARRMRVEAEQAEATALRAGKAADRAERAAAKLRSRADEIGAKRA